MVRSAGEVAVTKMRKGLLSLVPSGLVLIMRICWPPLLCFSLISSAQTPAPQVDWNQDSVRVTNRAERAIVAIFLGVEVEQAGHFRYASTIWDNLAPDHESNEVAPGHSREFKLDSGKSPDRKIFAAAYSNGEVVGDEAAASVLLRARRGAIDALESVITLLKDEVERHVRPEDISETMKNRLDRDQRAMRADITSGRNSDFSRDADFYVTRYLTEVLGRNDPESALQLLEKWRRRLANH